MNIFDRFVLRARAKRWTWVIAVLACATGAQADTKTAAPTSSIFRACPDALVNSSTSIMDHNGSQSWTIKLNGGPCSVDFRLEGKPQFNDDFTDLVGLSRGGSFRVDVTDGGVRRQLEILPGRDGLVRTWKVDGRERPYDEPARAWLAAFLIELDRRTGVGVNQRLPHLLKQGGVSAVLAETGLMSSEYARSVYYSKLSTAAQLSSDDIVRIFDQAASLKTTDYYATELMKKFGARLSGDKNLRAPMFRLIQGMSSDYYRVESVSAAVGTGKLGEQEMDFLIGIMPHMESGYYKTELLKKILTVGNLDPSQRKQLAGLARDIGDDSYAAEFVKALAASGDAGPGGARALIDAATNIQSDHYLSEAMRAILEHTRLTEADLLAIVKVVSEAKSDHYGSEILRRTVAHRAATDRVRQAALAATGGMSSHYRDEVARATTRP